MSCILHVPWSYIVFSLYEAIWYLEGINLWYIWLENIAFLSCIQYKSHVFNTQIVLMSDFQNKQFLLFSKHFSNFQRLKVIVKANSKDVFGKLNFKRFKIQKIILFKGTRLFVTCRLIQNKTATSRKLSQFWILINSCIK